jgi:iron complex outermembrane recepter protein
LTENSAPDHSTSLLWMQKLPLGFDFSVASYWVGKTKWSRNTWADKYHRVDARLGYAFQWAGKRGEIGYTAQSLNGAHGEFSAYGEPTDRIVERRHWLNLRLDL